MLTLDQIKTLLKDRRLYIVAKKTGISYPTLLALSRGESSNPSYKVLEKVSEYLCNK
jgi:transcriptional regulator with XRE-family HTH domain